MPAWILAALRLLGLGFGVGTGIELAQGLPPGIPARGGAGGVFDFLGGGGARARRRRRRRALTASDRADIAYIAATLGKPAGDRFASQLIAGLTR